MIPLAYGYLACVVMMSIVTFAVWGMDKRRARRDSRRVPEGTLHLLALCGGWPGALTGIRYFRHKTQKPKFTITVLSIVGLHLILIGTWFWLKTRYS